MNATPIDDQSCQAFEKVPRDLEPGVIHRFVVGADPAPRAMSSEQARAELGDPFATLLLLEGRFPMSADELLAAIDDTTPEGAALRDQMSFLVGEGGQLPRGARLTRRERTEASGSSSRAAGLRRVSTSC